ncbi:TrkA C-terminal domain-containing protein [Sphingomonas sp. MMS24-JH45]
MGEALDITGYVTEVVLPAGSPAVGETVQAFLDRHEGEVTVTQLLRGRGMRSAPLPDTELRKDDTLILGGQPDALERVIAGDRLVYEREEREKLQERRDKEQGGTAGEVGAIEAVVNVGSRLEGQTAGRLNRSACSGSTLSRSRVVASGYRGDWPTRRCARATLWCCRARSTPCRRGYVNSAACHWRNATCGWVEASDVAANLNPRRRHVPDRDGLGSSRGRLLRCGGYGDGDRRDQPTRGIRQCGMADSIMLGALIPVSDLLRITGASDVIATGLAQFATTLPAWGAVALIGGDGGDAVPEQCGNGAGDGANRGAIRGRPGLSA